MSSPYKVAIIGVGNIARFHAEALKKLGLKLRTVLESTTRNRRGFLQKNMGLQILLQLCRKFSTISVVGMV